MLFSRGGWENSVLFSRRRLRKFCAFLSVEAEKIPCFFLGGGCENSVLFSRWRLRKFCFFFFSRWRPSNFRAVFSVGAEEIMCLLPVWAVPSASGRPMCPVGNGWEDVVIPTRHLC